MTELLWFMVGFTVTLVIVCAANIIVETVSASK